MFHREIRILSAKLWVHSAERYWRWKVYMMIKWEKIGPQRAMSFPFLTRHLPHGKKELDTNLSNFIVGNITPEINREYIKLISPSGHRALRLSGSMLFWGQLDPALAYHELSHEMTWNDTILRISSVQSFSYVWHFATPWTEACQASLSIINCWSLLKFMSTISVMPSNSLILGCPLLLLLSIFPSIRVFSNELVFRIR